jgi:hypothetical protein
LCKSAKQSQFGPLQKKTFASALDRFFEQQCPQLGGHLTRQVIVNNVQSLVEEFYPPHSHLRMGKHIYSFPGLNILGWKDPTVIRETS